MNVITGASGHVGANLTRVILERNEAVRVLVREDRRALEGLDVELINGDVLDLESLLRAFKGARIIYHLAAKISMYKHDEKNMFRVNVEGTQNVIKACFTCRVERLVHFSSIHTLSPFPKDEVLDEAREFVDERKLSPYDRTKALAEKEIEKAIDRGLDAVVVCPTAIMGPFDFKPSYAGKTLLDIYHGRIPALIDGGFDWVDVRDVVNGALAAAKDGRSGERYIFSGKWYTVREICEMVRDITGCKIPRMVVPMWLARGFAPPVTLAARVLGKSPMFTSGALYVLRHYKYISHAKASKEFGYKPRPIARTISDLFKWFKDFGYLHNDL
ncbi:MAG: SDR family oxidoreductase [Spirochaetota bacterium]|nr:MAG: SDR family oxidoreductase [Spirochaetota bacterium]